MDRLLRRAELGQPWALRQRISRGLRLTWYDDGRQDPISEISLDGVSVDSDPDVLAFKAAISCVAVAASKSSQQHQSAAQRLDLSTGCWSWVPLPGYTFLPSTSTAELPAGISALGDRKLSLCSAARPLCQNMDQSLSHGIQLIFDIGSTTDWFTVHLRSEAPASTTKDVSVTDPA